jgi:hypothetical protein
MIFHVVSDEFNMALHEFNMALLCPCQPWTMPGAASDFSDTALLPSLAPVSATLLSDHILFHVVSDDVNMAHPFGLCKGLLQVLATHVRVTGMH